MRFFRRRKREYHPDSVVKVDHEEAVNDLTKAVSFRLDAQVQAVQADEAVGKLSRSLIRNGFAPAIEESVIRKYMGGAV